MDPMNGWSGMVTFLARLFLSAPTREHLRAFERDLKDASWFHRAFRPPLQGAFFVALRDPGEKAVLGHGGWLFYRPGLRYRVEPYPPQARSGEVAAAIVGFRDGLARRGIRLLVVPVPDNSIKTARGMLAGKRTSTQTFLAIKKEEMDSLDLTT